MNRKDKKTTTARVQGVLVLKVGLGSDYENSTGIIVGVTDVLKRSHPSHEVPMLFWPNRGPF